jgi:undecaprenyl-diphosphatase
MEQKETIEPRRITPALFGKLAVAFVIFMLPVLLLAKIVQEVREQQPIAFDTWVLQNLHQLTSSAMDVLAVAITTSGDALIIVPVMLLIVAIFIYKKHRAWATLLFASVIGVAAINVLVKGFFARPRPDFWTPIVTEHSYSFPSGHAMASSALALSFMVITWNTKWRWPSIALGAVYILLVGLSRLYLGVHFPTDVIGGWCISFLWVVIVTVTIWRIKVWRRKAQA